MSGAEILSCAVWHIFRLDSGCAGIDNRPLDTHQISNNHLPGLRQKHEHKTKPNAALA